MTSPPAERSGLARRRAARASGLRAERLAAWWLRLKGYSIVARGLRTKVGEIDLVARRGGTVAFVEVKRRADLPQASAAISHRQRTRIQRAAEAFLQSHPQMASLSARFDVVLIAPGRLPQHLANAWREEK